jgi:hypothetical protein
VSDARTEFFSSAAKASKAASRDDFFAGTYSPPEDKPAADYSKPYAYFTPEVQREVGNDGTGARALEEIPGGFNQGVAHLLGLPVTALVDAANLSSAGMGYCSRRSPATRRRTSSILSIRPRCHSPAPGTSSS